MAGAHNPLKDMTVREILNCYELPHKELFDKILQWHDETKGKDPKTRTDLEHFEDVVKCMNVLLKGDFPSEILEKKLKGSDEYRQLEDIIAQLDEGEKALLLCIALYHDIGKAILRPRHGPEGADIIKDSGYEDRKSFFNLGFYRSDIYLMSNLIRFHDYLAMVGTGETSYLTFTEVLYPVTNISLAEEEKFLDYLLLLNLADMAGSIVGEITSEDFTKYMHDFNLIKKAHKNISEKVYEDIFKEKPDKTISEEQLHKQTVSARDLIDVISELRRLTENTTIERLRRILRAGFKVSRSGLERTEKRRLSAYKKWIETPYKQTGQYQKTKEFEEWFVKDDVAPVIESARGLNIGQEFYTKFAFICKLDYELGFISALIEEMLRSELKSARKARRGAHDLRRDLALAVVKLVSTLVGAFGDFTSNNTRIGLGFERLKEMDKPYKQKFLGRLTGKDGGFKEAEALTKLRNSTNLWVITP